MDITVRLNQANGRLKSGKVGIKIEAKGTMLYLRTTLPPKPGKDLTKPYQQRIAIGVHANLAGISLAEQEAKKVGYLLDAGLFTWEPYLKQQPDVANTVAEWVAKFEQDYFSRRSRNPKSQTTWDSTYKRVFKTLNSVASLSADLLYTAIYTTPPDSHERRRYCMVLQALARFADIPLDVKPLRGAYNVRKLTPRDLPCDESILLWRDRIKSPAWQWVYGILAAFGLRPHEVFHLDTTDLQTGGYTIQVLEGKTGARKVWACLPEWVDLWQLRNPVLPNVNGRNNLELGGRVCQVFHRTNVPFKPYDLRHCWAIRTLEVGLDVTLAAQQMGHSVQVHTDVYHHWISDRHHQKAFDEIMAKRNITQ